MDEKSNPRYREEKAIAAVCHLVKLNGGKCDKYWLNKSMYYIERFSLLESGQPVFFDNLFSVPFGPIASAVNDGIDMSGYDYDSPWSKNFTLSGNDLSLKNEVSEKVLSPFEIQLIDTVFKKFQGWSFNRLKNFFHSLPEYKNTLSREPIHYEDILIAEGLDSNIIEEIMQEISYLGCLENALHVIR